MLFENTLECSTHPPGVNLEALADGDDVALAVVEEREKSVGDGELVVLALDADAQRPVEHVRAQRVELLEDGERLRGEH